MSFSDFQRGRSPKRSPRPRQFMGLEASSADSPANQQSPLSTSAGAARVGSLPVSQAVLSPLDVANELTYADLMDQIARLVFKVTNNIAVIDRLVGYLGTARDTQETRDQLHECTESTRDIIKRTTEHIKSLTFLVNEPGVDNRQRKLEQQKLSRDFQRVVEQFQIAQRRSIERTRQCVAVSKAHAMRNDQYGEGDPNAEEEALLVRPEQRLQLQAMENEVDYNEAIIEEREQEIQNISQGIAELNGVFNELGRIVGQQGSLIDNIEANVSNIGINVRNAAEELTTASRYQKRSRKWLCTILLVLALLTMVILLAVFAR